MDSQLHGNVEWTSLDLGRRLADLLPVEEIAVVDVLELGWHQRDADLAEELVESVARRADVSFLAQLARSDVDLAAQLALRRRDLLHDSELWRQPEPWQAPLLEAVVDRGDRDPALAEALIGAGNDRLAALAVREGLVPAGAVAEAIAATGFSATVRRQYTKVLGGINYVSERDDRGWRGLALAALAAADWEPIARRYGKRLGEHLGELDERSQLELAAKLLAASRTGPDGRDIMRVVFPVLHRALVNETLPESEWSLLDRALPLGSKWDRAERLRMALLESIEQESWTDDEVVQVIRDAGPEAERLRDLTDKRSDLRKLLDAAWEVLTFWS